jgi:DNA-binding FadR family transcriptional regulator
LKNKHNFKSLYRKRLYEEVAGSIKQAIFAGEYSVGDKLPSETELAKIFHVSRPVVREAIRYLEVTGLLKVRQGATGGAFVSAINSQLLQENVKDLLTLGQVSVGQLTEIRAYIDPEIARLAALRAEAKELELLERAVLLSKSLDPKTDFLESVENNARFHRLLGASSHNLFYSIIEDIIMDFTVEFIQTVQQEHEILHDPEEHVHIFEAVRSGEADRAEILTRAHIGKIGSQMSALEEVFLELSRQKAALNSR